MSTADNPITIIHVLCSYQVFGPEKTMINECRHLNRDGWRTIVVNIVPQEQVPIKDKIVDAGITYQWIPANRRVDVSALRQLRSLFSRYPNAVIHGHSYKADVYCLLASRGLPLVLTTTIHGGTMENTKVVLYERLQWVTWRFYDRVFSVSRPYLERALRHGVPEHKLALLYNGIIVKAGEPEVSPAAAGALRRQWGFSAERVVIGIVGRLSVEKRHMLFLDVAAELHRRRPEAGFVIVGDGRERAKLEARAKELGLDGAVVFAGHMDGIERAYRAMDVMTICSVREGLPNVLLEAMLYGVPVVSVPVGGVPDVIEGGEGGILVHSDKQGALVDALQGLVDSQERRRELAVRGRQRILNHFTFDKRMEAVRRHYQELIDARR